MIVRFIGLRCALAARSAGALLAPVRAGVTILLAEDDDGHAALLRRGLGKVGFTGPFVRLHDGEEVLEFLAGRNPSQAYQPNQPHVLILDVRMPKIDGIEVLRRIRRDQGLAGLPVIIFTTTDDPREVQMCQELGCSAYLVKPSHAQGFSEVVERMRPWLALGG